MALVDSAFVRAMREGWVVMIDEVNTARDVPLLSINATLDGASRCTWPRLARVSLCGPGSRCCSLTTQVSSARPDIPDARHLRFPATLEVTSSWAALAELGAPQSLVAEAMRLDRQRIAGEDGLC